MELLQITCLLILSGFAIVTAENGGSRFYEFNEDLIPESKWADPLESFDGHQISPTPTQTEPMEIVKDQSTHSRKMLSTYESKDQEPSPPETFDMSLQDAEEGSGQSTIKNNDTEEKLVKKQENGLKSKYDPALIMMGMGKRISAYDPTLNVKGNHESRYSPVLKHIEMDKRKHHFDPALKYMGMGKRNRRDIPEISSAGNNKRRVAHSILDKGTNSLFEEMPQTAFESRHADVENFAPEFTGSINSSPTEEGNTLKKKRSVFEKNEFDTNRIAKFKNKANTPNLEVSDIVYGNPIDNHKDPEKFTEHDISGMQNRPEVLDVLRHNFGYGKGSIGKDANGIRLEISPKHFKDLTSHALSINMDVGKRNIGRQSSKKFSYDPALKYMGLGKRQRNRGYISNYDPAFHYMGLGKRSDYEKAFQIHSYNNIFKNMDTGKRNNTDRNSKRVPYDPAFQYMGLGKRNDAEVNSKSKSYDPAFQYMGLGKRKDGEVNSQIESYDPAFHYFGLGKREDSEVNSKRESYDPAFHYMGLGKREDGEVNSKRESYDPAFQYMGLGKRNDVEANSKRESYDPAFHYMGLGKRENGEVNSKSKSYDPAFQYMGLGKRNDGEVNSQIESYDPAFHYFGLGKRNDVEVNSKRESYDPAFHYMGLGKREDSQINFKRESYDPAFQYMGLGKRNDVEANSKRESYDPAFHYMGLGKREDGEVNSKRESYDPAFQYMGLGKRNDIEANSKKESYDPAFHYMGLGKREGEVNSKKESYDPAFQYMGLGKRNDAEVNSKRDSYDPAFHYMGLGKRDDGEVNSKKVSYDPAFQYMGLGKRNDAEVNSKRESYDPAFHYMGLGKREDGEVNLKRESYDPAFQYMGLGKRNDAAVNSKRESYDPAFQYMGLGKRNDSEANSKTESYDPAFQYIGLEKKSNPDIFFKRDPYDPAFQYMGLGKRKNKLSSEKQSSSFKDMGFGNRLNSRGARSANFDPALRYLGLGKRFTDGIPLKNLDLLSMDKRERSHKKNYISSAGQLSFGKSKKRRETPVSNYDPAFQFMGLGKKDNVGMSSNKREKSRQQSLAFDPALKYMGLGKRNENLGKAFFDPAFKYTGLGKRIRNEGSSGIHFDPALKYLGLGKRLVNHFILSKSVYDPARNDQQIIPNANFDSALQNRGFGKQETLERPKVIPSRMRELKRGNNLKSSMQIANYDPAFNYMGLGKRGDIFNTREQIKKANMFDPTLQYMGLGKRKQHPKSLNLKNGFPSDVQLLESIFADSKRVKRQIESEEGDDEIFGVKRIKGKIESKEEDKERNIESREKDQVSDSKTINRQIESEKSILGKEAFYGFIPIESDETKDILESKKDEPYPKLHRIDNIDTPRGILPHKIDDLEGALINISGGDEDYEDFEYLPLHLHGPNSKACANYPILCYKNPRNDETKNFDSSLWMGEKMQNLPELQTNETSFPGETHNETEELPGIKTTESSSNNRSPHKIQDFSGIESSETSFTERAPGVILQNLPKIKTIETSSPDRYSHRIQDLPEIDASRIQKLPNVKTDEASSNNRASRTARDLGRIKTPTTISDEAALQDLSGTKAPRTDRHDESRNKFKVDGGEMDIEGSEHRILNVKRNIMDMDHRPRYNPGWVFIGLGKRSSSLMDTDTKMSFLSKCYYLLGKIHDALMRLQYRTKKFPSRLQPDPFGFRHKTVGKNAKSNAGDVHNTQSNAEDVHDTQSNSGDVHNTKSQAGVRVLSRSFRRMMEIKGKE